MADSEAVVPTPAAEPEKKEKKRHKSISSYALLLILIVVVAIISIVVSFFTSEVSGASLYTLLTAPVKGFLDAIEIILFLFILGGCMALVNAVDALNAGVRALVRALKGHEYLLIAVIMAVFALLGSAYGFCEEAVPFYALLSLAMVAAGMDTVVASATVLMGAGVGCIGATVNPFANGIAEAILTSAGIDVNAGIVIIIGLIIAVLAYVIALLFILRYARKVRNHLDRSILSPAEKDAMFEYYSGAAATTDGDATSEEISTAVSGDDEKMTGTQKVALALFAFTFIVMIVGFIPWSDFGIGIFEIGGVQDADGNWTTVPWSGLLTGNPIGQWYFDDASVWFFIMSLVIGFVVRNDVESVTDTWVAGAADMMSVGIIIGLARGISVLLGTTGLENVLLDVMSDGMQAAGPIFFVPICFIFFMVISIVIPSTSALATLAMPIVGPVAVSLGYSTEIVVMCFVAGNGVANLFSPAASFLPGLALAKVEYATWIRWCIAPTIVLAVMCIVVLTGALFIL